MPDPLRVLVVDDDPGVLRLATTVLDKAGYSVHGCANGEDAKRYLVDHPIDLLLTDKDLGAVSGVEVAKTARAIKPGLPVVLMTGAPELHAVVALKFEGYLVKPFKNNKAIQDAVAAAIESHQGIKAREEMTQKLKEVMAQLASAKKGV
jgi:two-component system, NtrC family, response regulator GlrR